jgi:HK97 family phage portal protein
VSIGDPALAEYFGRGLANEAGISLTEGSALGLSAIWRSVVLIAGTIGTLPLKTYERGPNGSRAQVASFLDNPHPDMTPFEWTELVMAHELLWGNEYLYNIFGGAGQIVGLTPLAPWTVTVDRDRDTGEKTFQTRDIKGVLHTLSSLEITHIPAFGTDGLRGLSPIAVARQSLGTALAGNKAAGRMFRSGLLMGGILSPKSETLTKTQKDQALAGLRDQSGADHAGDIAFVPAAMDFRPWVMNAVDAQFLESQHFGIEECSRWMGVPRELLSESGASSWGSGIQEIVRAFARFCLMSWTTRIEQRLSTLLPDSQFCEYDYSRFLQPAPEDEIRLLIEQINSKLLSIDEARAIRNLPPLTDAQKTDIEEARNPQNQPTEEVING